MSTIELTNENFNKTITDNEIVLIDFWAEWCGPCKMFGPVFEKAAEKYPEIAFAKVNNEVEQELAGSFGIRSIPTLAVYRDQTLIFSQPGALPADALEDLIGQIKNLDMTEVRSQIEKEEQTAAQAM